MIFGDNFFLKHPARLVIDRMSDILVGPILALLTWHRHKKPRGAVDDLEIADHKAVVKRDRNVSPKFILVDRKDPNLGDMHRDPQLIQVHYPYQCGSKAWNLVIELSTLPNTLGPPPPLPSIYERRPVPFG